MPIVNSPLHVVFLQGMPSPFFAQVGKHLLQKGCKVTGISLCLGDWLFWRRHRTIHFRGRLAQWPEFFTKFLENEQVTDLVLLGEQRDYHKEAVAIAQERGVRVTVTDFGYLRPDWITLERDGMNGNSHFPKEAEAVTALAAKFPEVDLSQRYKDSNFVMSVGDLAYSFSNVLLWFFYPYYRRSDQRAHPLRYFPSMGLRMLLADGRHQIACANMEKLLTAQIPYYLFPLQLEHDFQIVAYSPFKRLEDAIRLVIQSFTTHAPKDTHLVVKTHPWDPGFTNWEKCLRRIAQEYSVQERVHCMDGGNLAEMIQASRGMVTVNSTAAIQALQLGSSVITLADAIYNIRGMTNQEGIDRFWTEATPPDATLVHDFIKALVGTVQIRGVFFREPGMSDAALEMATRIYEDTVGLR